MDIGAAALEMEGTFCGEDPYLNTAHADTWMEKVIT